MSQRTPAAAIRFEATLRRIESSTILRLPPRASASLPSRGQVAVHGTMNGRGFRTVLEPDGERGHWMRVDEGLLKAARTSPGESATLTVEPVPDWPEPNLPRDFQSALAAAPQRVRDLWNAITPMARWEWIRWVNATRNSSTRSRRIEVTLSKMSSAKRRPCCFDLSACTDPQLSSNGRLLEPE